MECFTADVLQFFTKKASKFGFWVNGWYSPTNRSISEIFLKSPNFLRFRVVSWLATREATHTFIFW